MRKSISRTVSLQLTANKFSRLKMPSDLDIFRITLQHYMPEIWSLSIGSFSSISTGYSVTISSEDVVSSNSGFKLPFRLSIVEVSGQWYDMYQSPDPLVLDRRGTESIACDDLYIMSDYTNPRRQYMSVLFEGYLKEQ